MSKSRRRQTRKAAAELDVEIELLADDTRKMEEKQELAHAEMQDSDIQEASAGASFSLRRSASQAVFRTTRRAARLWLAATNVHRA